MLCTSNHIGTTVDVHVHIGIQSMDGGTGIFINGRGSTLTHHCPLGGAYMNMRVYIHESVHLSNRDKTKQGCSRFGANLAGWVGSLDNRRDIFEDS